MPERIISQKRKKGIAMINFAQIKQAVTTRQAAEAYGLSVNSRDMCRCPFHNDQTPSMKVDETFYCFGCGAVGDVITFTARLFGISAGSAARKLEGSGFWNRRRRCGCHPEIPVTAKIRGLGVSRPGGSAGIQSAAREVEVQATQSGAGLPASLYGSTSKQRHSKGAAVGAVLWYGGRKTGHLFTLQGETQGI